MTLVDPDGNSISSDEDDYQWAIEAVFYWLDDDRIYNGAVRRRLFTRQRLFTIGTMLNAAMKSRAPVSAANLKEYLRILLGNDAMRVSIARLILEKEEQNREADAIYAQDEYPKCLATWEEQFRLGQACAEDRPPEPTEVIPARNRHAVMKELRDLWKKLREA